MKAWMKGLAVIGGAALVNLAAPIQARELPYPQKGPIEITVLFPAGSSADVTARLLADGMAKQLGAHVIIVNRPGAGGAIGYRHVADQKPDGYSLVWNSNSISTTYHSGLLPFDYHAFDPVARVLVEAPVIAVRSDSKWKTLAELIADAKSRPGEITVGNSGVGSHTHISSVALFKTAGVEVVDVPFAAAQIVPSLIGGHVDVLVQLPAALSSYVKTGRVRLLAALTPKRDPALPDVPTAQEQGFDVSLEAWRGIAVPKGTPKPVIAMIETAIQKTVESADFANGSKKFGVGPAFMPADEFGALIAKEDATLARFLQVIGLKKQP
ncbi:MAG TPA: tripartite tricarboxylate transporter substrate binding protein [Acidiferrobacterales bacterium]|nr:tripartite tricarboxylate transporter substrate binding protein [Acidiferrobacterales bacterium]